jgi:ferredoxin
MNIKRIVRKVTTFISFLLFPVILNYLSPYVSIDVMHEIKTGKVYSHDCILCGQCVDVCPKKVLSFHMKEVKK